MARRSEPIEQRIIRGALSALGRWIAAVVRLFLPGLTRPEPVSGEALFTSWKRVLELRHHGDAEHLKSALVEADKLLDQVLSGLVAGETLGDRLKRARAKFSHPQAYDRAWQGHKVRNQLVHELEHNIGPERLKGAIEDIEAALRDLGYL